MPVLILSTNFVIDENSKSSLITGLSTVLAKQTGQDNFHFVFRQIAEDDPIAMRENEPIAKVKCQVPGNGDISFSEMKSLSRSIGDFTCDHLQIAYHRIYLSFSRC